MIDESGLTVIDIALSRGITQRTDMKKNFAKKLRLALLVAATLQGGAACATDLFWIRGHSFWNLRYTPFSICEFSVCSGTLYQPGDNIIFTGGSDDPEIRSGGIDVPPEFGLIRFKYNGYVVWGTQHATILPSYMTGTSNPSTITVDAGVSTEIKNVDLRGVYDYVKNGAGELVLTSDVGHGAIKYSGKTRIDMGTLTDKSEWWLTPEFAIASGATFKVDRSVDTIYYATTISGAGSWLKTGAGNFSFAPFGVDSHIRMSAGGLIDVRQGSLSIGDNNNDDWSTNLSSLNVESAAWFHGGRSSVRVDKLTGAGNVEIGDSMHSGSINIGLNNGSATFSGLLQGVNGSLTKSGTGTQTLTGLNSYKGTTSVQTGSLYINGDQSAATGATSVSNFATLGGSGKTGGAVSVGATAHLAPGSAANTVGTLTTASLTLDSGSFIDFDIQNSTTSDLIKTGDLVLDGQINVFGTMTRGTYPIIKFTGSLTDHTLALASLPAGVPSAEVSIVVDGTNGVVNLVYGAPATYWDTKPVTRPNGQVDGGTGNWTTATSDTNWTSASGASNGSWLTDGIAQFGGDAGTVTVINSGATNIGGLSFTTSGYQISSGTLTGTAATNTLTAAAGITATIGSVLAGSNAFKADGAGTITLGGNNTWTGTTTVSSGALFINGNQSAATGATTVQSGATLGGSGTIGGSVNVLSGGSLAAGSAANLVGTLTMKALSMQSGAAINFDLASVSSTDHFAVTNLTLDGTLNIGGFPTAGTSYPIIHYSGTLTNNGLLIGTVPVGTSSQYSIDTSVPNEIRLVYNPAGTYWDVTPKNNSSVDGGTGNWTAAISDSNWTVSGGSANGAWLGDGIARFGGTAGVVTVDNSGGAVNIGGLSFTTNGYQISSGTLTGTATTNTLTAAAGITATIGSVLAGSNAFKADGAGTITLSGNNTFTGTTTVSSGALFVNGNQSAATGATTVQSGATLGGSGTIGGAVSVLSGGSLAAGSAANLVGTLTMQALSMQSGAAINFDLASVSSTDHFAVTNLTLDGTLNIGGFPTAGTSYPIIHYSGTLTNNGLLIGTVPVGTSSQYSIDTSVPNEVRLVYSPGGTYWDANTTTKNNNLVNGGTGTWTAGSSDSNWTTSGGQANSAWLSGGVAHFDPLGGAVSVDISAGAINITGLSFTDNNYVLSNGELVGTGTTTLSASAGVSASIGTVLKGSTAITKDGTGTIVLSGANAYTGATSITAGTLKLGASGTLPTLSALSVSAGSTLDLNGKAQTSASLTGAGVLALGSGGALTLTGSSSFSGTFTGTGKVILSTGSNLTLAVSTSTTGLEIELAGGTLTLGTGGVNVSVGTLTVSGASTLAMSAGNPRLTAATLGVTATGTATALSITGWTVSNGHLYAGAFAGGSQYRAGSSPENRISFGSPYTNATSNWGIANEITPVLSSVVISGAAFVDNGVSSGTANNGIMEAGEGGRSGVAVSLTNCVSTVYASASTNASGAWSMNVPLSIVTGSNVCVAETNDSSIISTGASIATTALISGSATSVAGKTYTYNRSADSILFVWDGSARSGINFGDVASATFSAVAQKATPAAVPIIFAHSFVAGSTGTLTFASSLNQGTWLLSVFNDANCDGELDGATDIAYSGTATVSIPSSRIGQEVCFLVQVTPPSGTSDGTSGAVTLSAAMGYTGANPALTQTIAAVDTVVVNANAALILEKSVCNTRTSASSCANASDFGTSNIALPGDTLVYRTVYTNRSGHGAFTQVKVLDETPRFTTFLKAEIEALGTGLTGCTKTTPAGSGVSCATVQSTGGVGAVEWAFTGSLQLGASSAVRMTVRVNN